MSATVEQVMAALDARDAAAGAQTPQGDPAAPLAPVAAAVAAPAPHRQEAVLQRWQRVAGDAPLPQPGGLNLTQQMQLREADPELHLILSGQPLPASLELQLLQGTFPAEQPRVDPEVERRAAVERIVAGGNPWMPGAANITAQLHLERLDPQAAAQLRAAALPAIQARQQQQAAAEQQRQAERQEAANEAARAEQIARARATFGLDG
jgi:hypothetical protein